MKINTLNAIAIAAIGFAYVAAPSPVQAQRYDHNQIRNDGNRDRGRGVRDLVNRTERESNSFRDYFEHNFRSNGHRETWGPASDGGHREHQGRNGQMTLRDSIQNLDEAMERLRSEIDHNGRSRKARDIMNDVQDHAREVDQRIGRVADWYNFNGPRGRGRWNFDRSELNSRWRELRGDINNLARTV